MLRFLLCTVLHQHRPVHYLGERLPHSYCLRCWRWLS